LTSNLCEVKKERGGVLVEKFLGKFFLQAMYDTPKGKRGG